MKSEDEDVVFDKNVVVLGPSHVVRWEHAVSKGALQSPFLHTTFVGGGGLPIWSAHLLARAKILAPSADKLLLVVPDFRFGNSIAGVSPPPEALFSDGHRNVSREYLNPSVDRLLFERCVKALDQWREMFGSKLEIVHWTALTRRNEDVLLGKYLNDGSYRHPIWDFSRLQSDDLTALSKAPPQILRTLYIDDNLHPSALGFRYLALRVLTKRPADALRESIAWMDEQVSSWVQPGDATPLLVTGDSVWVKSVLRQLFGRPLQTLKTMGIHVHSMNFDGIVEYVAAHNIGKVLFVTDHGAHREDFSPGRFQDIQARISRVNSGPEVTIFPWAAVTREIVSRRHMDLSYLKAPASSRLVEWLSRCNAAVYAESPQYDNIVDLGVELLPTLKGIELLLCLCR